jgi:cobalt-zinc-cadmium efflux system protein
MARHGHAEEHGGHGLRKMERYRLVLSLIVTVAVMAIEIAGGILSNSIALISDAGHMFTHVFAIGLALAATVAAAQPACHHRTFGLVRAEILAAFANSLVLMAAAAYIIYESVERFFHPVDILSRDMLAVAVLGLVANLASIWILRGTGKKDINIRGVILHMLADAVSSVAIVGGALIIFYTGWVFVDPLISIGISMLIVAWGWGLLKDSGRILLQASPPGINSDDVAKEILETFPEIERVQKGRLWTLTADRCIYTAHLTLREGSRGDTLLLDRIACHLKEEFNIVETTLQVLR